MKNIYQVVAFTLLFGINYSTTEAQPLQDKKVFTRQDTLRGSITPARAWWDVVMYDLHVQPDFTRFTISGSNTILFKIVKTPQARMQIDLQDPILIDS